MLYAWINEETRAPRIKGERAVCRNCCKEVTSVMPAENVPHWRHRAGDCDRWSEPEGTWHRNWKSAFEPSCREVSLTDSSSGERHRADILCGAGTSEATVLELQHSSISEEERKSREAFYTMRHRMFWLVDIHDENSFLGSVFGLSLNLSSQPVLYQGKNFGVMRWVGRNKQFIEKWKRSDSHVFFDYRGRIFYLANKQLSLKIGGPFERGIYALCYISRDRFVKAVLGSGA